MANCCFFFNVRTGCLIGASTFLISAVVKTILLQAMDLPDGPETVIILNIVLLAIAGIILIVGVLTEDRVCIITFICFNACAMTIQSIGLLVSYIDSSDEKIAYWILVVVVMEHGPFIYMIPIAMLEFKIVKEKHMRVAERYESSSSRRRIEPGVPTSLASPALGF